ncbi:MAG: D-glycerate dehydrogenase [Pseudomonadota bacterium]
MKKRVLITRLIPEIGIELLKERYDVDVFSGPQSMDRETLLQKIRAYDALVSLLSDRIDEQVLAAGKNLKIVANYAVGYNNIDIPAAKRRNILVTNTPGVLTNATGEIAFALLITLTRRIIAADQFTRDGKFIGWDPLLFLGDELKGKTAGILGMGRIGLDMAFKCRAFGMSVIYHNRKRVSVDMEQKVDACYVSFDQLLERSDIISIHTPLTKDTRHLLGEESFQKMKRGVYVVNTSRGEIVDEAVLVKYLKSGKVKGAGLDVYEFEPAIAKEFFTFSNVVLLPHIGSATIETRDKMSVMVAKNVISALEGEKPENLIPELSD